MERTDTYKGRGLIIFLVAVLVISFVIIGLTLLKQWEAKRGIFSEQPAENSNLTYDGVEYQPKENIETFLVLGLDKFDGHSSADSYNNDQQADFLALFVFDNDSKEYSLIHINRDTMAKVNILGVAGNKVGDTTSQIALAHTYGNGRDVSCRNTADAVSELLLGIKVNHYISLKMDTVSVVNDFIGGVEVEVLDDFTGIDDTLVKGEKVTLLGEHALNYVRTRRGLEDATNDARMARQQQYMVALRDKVQELSEKDSEFVIDLLTEISDYIVSDRSVTQMQVLAEKFNQYKFLGIREFEGSSRLGEEFIEFYPDKDSLTEIVIEAFYQPVSDTTTDNK